MPSKCKCPPCQEGAPLWALTFGDMMSLLLTFFILLVSLSELKKEDEFRVIAELVQKSFGMRGGGGRVESPTDPEMSLRKRLEQLEMRSHIQRQVSNTDDPGMEGREMQVETVRPGWKFVVGGRITFEPQSADLSDEGKAQLRRVLGELQGYNNKIEIIGHASNLEHAGESPFGDLVTLSYHRAKAVEDYLTSDEIGRPVRRDRIRLIAAGAREPLIRKEYSEDSHRNNRRVEIVVTEAVVDDFTIPQELH